MVVIFAFVFPTAISLKRRLTEKTERVLTAVLCAADSVPVLAFAAVGFGHGVKLTGSPLIGILGGFLTAAGGGAIAILVRSVGQNRGERKEYLCEMFSHVRVPYFLLCLITAVTWAMLQSIGASVNLALVVLVVPVIVLGFMVDKAMQD